MPVSGSSVISTSASSALVVGSQPGNSMPAALRTRLRPPSHPTRYCARRRWPSDTLDVDAGVVLREAGHLTSAIDRHRQLADPAGEYALDVVLPEPEPVGVPGGKVADVQTGAGEPRDLSLPAPPQGTDRRFRADREPRWCVSADRLRASRGGPGWRAARRWRRRRPPTPARPPTSALSDLLRRSPPHVRSSPHSGRHHADRDPYVVNNTPFPTFVGSGPTRGRRTCEHATLDRPWSRRRPCARPGCP